MTEPLIQITYTLAIGVTGHRALAAPDGVRQDLAAVVARAMEGFAAEAAMRAPRLRILSPLAEGADRLFAEVGLEAGGVLHSVLPFLRDEYEKDFADQGSRAAFRTLLGRAQRVLELDGDPFARDEAYLHAGHLLVSHCDVLIAVWDGEGGRGRGGTADIVNQALHEELIVVVVDPDGRKPPEIIDPRHHARRLDLAELPGRVRDLLTPPTGQSHASSAVELSTFLAEKRPRAGFGALFDLFTDAVSLRMRRRRAGADWLAASRADWRGPLSTSPRLAGVLSACAEGDVAEVFARADTLARQYAGFYRSTFVMNFLLSALAVLIAVFGAPTPTIAATAGELTIIVLIIYLTWRANKQNWHERWIEYRHLAEQVRPLRFLFPLGLNLPKGHIGRPVQGKDQSSAWIDWLTRRLERDLGLPNAKVDPAYLIDLNHFVSVAVLDNQTAYHNANAKRFHTVDHRLHVAGLTLFQITAVACAAELLLQLAPQSGIAAALHAIQPLLFKLSGISPAFGAAILGIRNVGEFNRLERRSHAMAAALAQTGVHLSQPTHSGSEREHLSAQLLSVAAQMMSETADWRTLVITRRIEWPG